MDFIFTTSEWIANKKIYPALRLFLNSIFCISIATFTYSHCYPEQTSILKDAQVSILGWFVDGNFFLPIVMILLVWLSTWFIGVLVWYTFRWFLSRSLRKKNLRIRNRKTRCRWRPIHCQKVNTPIYLPAFYPSRNSPVLCGTQNCPNRRRAE